MTTETSNARGWVLERLRGVLEHGKMGDKCLIAPDLVTAAIAALSAPQPPAEAQPVAKLVNRKDADGGKTTTFIRPTSLGMDLPLGEYPLHLHPSAPVGVEGLIEDWESNLAEDKRDGVAEVAIRVQEIHLEQLRTLAQQPAAVCTCPHQDAREPYHDVACPARLAQQPAAVDGAYPTPRNRAEAVALARLALAYIGVIDAHIDAAIARCETDLTAQHQEPKS